MENITRVMLITTLTLVLGSVASVPAFIRDVRCVKAEMLAQYTKMHVARCEHCNLYFHCEASRKARKECGTSRYISEMAITISECHEVSLLGRVSPVGSDYRFASSYGFSLGNCYRRYGCARNCTYNPANGSCVASMCKTLLKIGLYTP